ncbi:MAG: flagellar hook-basal body complex protein FliE [Deltaproteobacteria bacterium]|nr:flagellar hook-basal body complex protein FliE [Deltaproteobacteria bacterium]
MAVDALSMLRGVHPNDHMEQLARPERAGPLGPIGVGGGVGAPSGADQPDFGQALERALGRVADAQATADGKAMAFLTGQDMPIHEVMIAVTEAELAVQMTTAVAAKAIAAYQEIWRMDI